MKIEWSDDLSTNIPLIDIQHKNLITKINEFLQAVSRGRGQKEIAKAISIFEEFVNSHFETEEKSMLQYKFPDYKLHKNQHEKFIKVVESLRIEYDVNKLTSNFDKSDFVRKIKTVLLSYLQDHISKLDKPLALYLRKKKA